MKYKVGDTVVLKKFDDLSKECMDKILGLTDLSIVDFCGKVFHIDATEENAGFYTAIKDGYIYRFPEDMIADICDSGSAVVTKMRYALADYCDKCVDCAYCPLEAKDFNFDCDSFLQSAGGKYIIDDANVIAAYNLVFGTPKCSNDHKPSQDNKKELVDHPSHYGGADNPYEVIKVLHEWGLDKDTYLWNAAKYIARQGKKEGNPVVQELKKAKFYLDYKIKLLEEDANE